MTHEVEWEGHEGDREGEAPDLGPWIQALILWLSHLHYKRQIKSALVSGSNPRNYNSKKLTGCHDSSFST